MIKKSERLILISAESKKGLRDLKKLPHDRDKGETF